MLRALSRVSRLPAAFGLLFVLAACASSAAPPPQRQAAPQRAPTPTAAAPRTVDPSGPVRIALLVPLGSSDTGTATIAEALVNAARMAVTDLADPAIDLRVLDTAGTPAGARSAAETAIGEGASLILGPLFARSTEAVAEVAGREGLNVISFSTDSRVAGGPVFLSGFLPEREAERVVGLAAARGYDRIAVFHPNDEYGLAGRRGAEAAAARYGAGLLFALSYPRTFQGIEKNAAAFAEAATGSGVNAVLIPERGQGLSAAASFLDYDGVDPAEVKYLGLGEWNVPATLREASLRGGWFPAPDPARVESFASFYEARYGTRPPFLAVLGYDAVQVVGQLLEEARRSGSRTPFAREAIARGMGFEGIVGALRFEPDGLNRRALAVLEVGEGQFEIVDPAPSRLDLGL